MRSSYKYIIVCLTSFGRPGIPVMSAREMNQALISAIKSFDVDSVEKLLKNDIEIECANGTHHSALYIAIKLIKAGITSLDIDGISWMSNKHLDLMRNSEALRRIVKVLLESGQFNVNALTDSCQTALHLAIEKCRCKRICGEEYKEISGDEYKDLVNAIVRLLLKNNANINAKTSIGETPVMTASEHGCSHIVELLLDWRDELGAGLDLNARDVNGETALIKAAKSADVDVVELLLKHGCMDTFQDHRGFYA